MNLNELKKISIIEYARSELNLSPVAISRGKYSLQEYDSVIINPETNLFYRFSRSAGGSIIDFVMMFENLSFKQAVEKLNKYENPQLVDAYSATTTKSQTVAINFGNLPEKMDHERNVVGYLCKHRLIDADIVIDWISNKILYQDTNRNAVFVGYHKGNPYFATKVGTIPTIRFKRDVEGSFKEVGIYIKNNNTDTLKVFESPIDALSYMTMLKQSGKAYKNVDYLIGGGTGAIPNSILFNLAHRGSHIKNIEMCVDNDDAGKEITIKATEILSSNHPDIIIGANLPKLKDWNDDLLAKHALENNISFVIDIKNHKVVFSNGRNSIIDDDSFYYDGKRFEIDDDLENNLAKHVGLLFTKVVEDKQKALTR